MVGLSVGLSGRLETALSLALPYGEAENFKEKQRAAVLVLFGRSRCVGSFEVLFLQRADTVVHHKSQIAFPGGRVEPSDGVLGDAFVCAALRETYEEVGIPSELVRVLGVLPELRTVTGFLITPVVGMLECAIEDVPLRIDSNEVAEAFWLSLVGLEHPQTYRLEYFLAGETRYPTHCFRLGDRKIWGITATILKNLLDRLAQVQ